MSTYTDLIDDIEPRSSNEAIIASVIEKNRIIKRRKIRNLSVSAFVLTIFMAMTITVGAVNDWDYSAVLRRVFNNNPFVANSMENDINYEITNNTYDDITFELTGLYADDESLFLIVDIKAEKPKFTEDDAMHVGNAPSSLVLISEISGSESVYYTDFSSSDFSYHFIDETRMIAVIFFTEPISDGGAITNVFPIKEAVATGREFTLLFGNTTLSDAHSLPLSGGGAEVRFTVDEINKQGSIKLNPDVSLRGVAILSELKITPFSFLARFEGNGIGAITYTHDSGVITKIQVMMSDGERIPLDYWGGGSKRGLLRSFSIGYLGHDNERHGWAGSFQHDMLLDIDEIIAVIIDDTVIPVIR